MSEQNPTWTVHHITKKNKTKRTIKVGGRAILDTELEKSIISLNKIETINMTNVPPFIVEEQTVVSRSENIYFSINTRKMIGSVTYHFEAQSPEQRIEIVHTILEQMKVLHILPQNGYEASRLAVQTARNLVLRTALKLQFVNENDVDNDPPPIQWTVPCRVSGLKEPIEIPVSAVMSPQDIDTSILNDQSPWWL